MMVFKMFVYQATFNMLELKKIVIGQKSKGLFKSNLLSAFLPNIKYFGYKIGKQFNNIPLFLEQTIM